MSSTIMQPLRHPKATYLAAFLLGALLALIAIRPARAAEPFRLDRIGIVQFSAASADQLQLRRGVLSLSNGIAWRGSFMQARPANFNPMLLDRPLVRVDAWLAYVSLGTNATVGFELLEGAQKFWVGDDSYFAVGLSQDNLVANGLLINLSTRSYLPAGSTSVIAGFVIEDRARTVLVRAVGPTLRKFGISAFVGNPRLTLTRDARPVFTNDDWSASPQNSELRLAATRVGAFALDEGSRDAAGLVILGPGAYSLQVESADLNTPVGEVLVEVYTVPDDFFLSSSETP